MSAILADEWKYMTGLSLELDHYHWITYPALVDSWNGFSNDANEVVERLRQHVAEYEAKYGMTSEEFLRNIETMPEEWNTHCWKKILDRFVLNGIQMAL